MLKLGGTNINKAYLGATEIKKAYLGSTEVFSTGSTLANGLVNGWGFNETTGTTLTDLVSSNNGSNSGVIINQAGILGTSYSFDGLNDQIQLTSSLNLAATFTMSFWLKIPEENGNRGICNFSNLVIFRRRANITGGPQVAFNDLITESLSTSLFPDDIWTLLTITYDGSDVRMYFDDTNVGTFAYASVNKSSVTSYIGRLSGGSFYKGNISYAYVWDRHLTAAEVTELYNGGTGLTVAQIQA